MKNFFFVFSLFLSELFMTFYAIVGAEYEGGETTPFFTLLLFFVGFVTLFFLIKDSASFYKSSFFYFSLFGIPIILFAINLIEGVGMYGRNVFSFFKITIGYVIPMIITGIYVSKEGLLKYSRNIHLVMLLITIAILPSIRNAIGGLGVGIGGANYQTLSYYSALAFCLNLCFILYKRDLAVFKIFDNHVFHYVSYFLLLIQLAGCLISGGRGGFVYLAICSIYMLFKTGKLSKLFSVIAFSLVLFIVIYSLGSDSKVIETINIQMERTFSYVNSSGIDMSETSNRDIIYQDAQKYIEDHLLIGGGLFRSRVDFGGYPHNFFLEILMQGGWGYFSIWIILFVIVFKRIHFLITKKRDFLLLPISMYPGIMLLFTGTYLWTPLFWFIIVYSIYRCELLCKK